MKQIKLQILVQVGIRSMDASERKPNESDKVFFAHDMAVNEYWMDDCNRSINKIMYLLHLIWMH